MLDQLVDGLAVMSEEEKEKMMQKYEETVPRGVREKMTGSVVGRKTIDKLVDERRFEKERQRKVRLIKEGIRRKFFQQESGPNDILNFGMYEGWRFGDVYICHPTYGEWAVEQTKPKMWKLKCFKFFLMRLADLDRVLQREESLEQVNITRVEMCEGLMEEMAAEEQQAVQESRMVRKQGCKKVGKQGIRWVDMEESQIEIDEKKRLEESQEDSGTRVERWVSYDMAVEEHEVLMPTEDGSTREAFEPRGSKGLECQQDGDRKTGKGGRGEREEGGKERHEEGGKEGGRDERERQVGRRDRSKAAKRDSRKAAAQSGKMKAVSRSFGGGKMTGKMKGAKCSGGKMMLLSRKWRS